MVLPTKEQISALRLGRKEYTLVEIERILLESKVGKFLEHYWLPDSDLKNLFASAEGAFPRKLHNYFLDIQLTGSYLCRLYSKPRVFYETNDGIHFLRFIVDFSAIAPTRGLGFKLKFGTLNVFYGIILLTPEEIGFKGKIDIAIPLELAAELCKGNTESPNFRVSRTNEDSVEYSGNGLRTKLTLPRKCCEYFPLLSLQGWALAAVKRSLRPGWPRRHHEGHAITFG
jgi:hypothetical protein